MGVVEGTSYRGHRVNPGGLPGARIPCIRLPYCSEGKARFSTLTSRQMSSSLYSIRVNEVFLVRLREGNRGSEALVHHFPILDAHLDAQDTTLADEPVKIMVT